MPPGQTIQSGQDVTALMGGAPPTPPPKSGDDVTALMTPTFRSTNEKDANGNATAVPFRGTMLDQGIGDTAIGIAKGAASTAINLGELAQHTPVIKQFVQMVNKHLYGLTPAQQLAALDAARASIQPSNLTQKVGKAAEQVGELIVPSQEIANAGAKAAEVAVPLTKYVAPSVARALPRMAVEAAGGAGMAAAQGGNPVVGAVLGAAGPAVSEGVGTLGPKLAASANKSMSQALGATKERYKAMAQNLVPELLKRGIWGSRESILKQSAAALEESGEAFDALLSQHGDQPVSVQPITDALERAKDAFRTSKVMSINEALTKGYVSLKNGGVVTPTNVQLLPNNMVDVSIELEPRALRQLSALQKTISDVGPVSDVAQLRAIRQAWDKVVAQAGGYAQRAPGGIGVPLKDQSEAFAKREGANAIRSLLATEAPDLAALNKEYSFWKSLNEVVTQTVQRTTSQQGSLTKQVAEAGVAAASSSKGVGTALLAKKFGGLVHQVVTSPTWRTVSANLKDRLATSLMSGTDAEAWAVLRQIAAAQGSKLPATAASPAR
jgi:hypothetical protein